MNAPDTINIGVSHQIGDYADAIRVPAGYEQIITSGPPQTEGGERDLARIGALVSDHARCRMLLALGDGRALPAGGLATEAGVSAATASSHLNKLTVGGLLVVEAAGRRRNYRLASPQVADLIEVLERLAPALPVRSLKQSQRARAWRQARVCYDHVAGRLGVEVMRAMVERGHLEPVDEAAGSDAGEFWFAITAEGGAFLESFGVTVPPSRRPVRHHPDSTEVGSHLSGALGRALLARFADLGWVRRQKNQRLQITPDGLSGFGQQFGLQLDQ
jgi:DNA-binding transcriptional ArsR family regulator